MLKLDKPFIDKIISDNLSFLTVQIWGVKVFLLHFFVVDNFTLRFGSVDPQVLRMRILETKILLFQLNRILSTGVKYISTFKSISGLSSSHRGTAGLSRLVVIIAEY